MPIIYTYPAKNTPVGSDLIIISDSEANKITKRATLSTAVTNNQIKYDLNATQDGSNVDVNLTSSDASDNSVVQFTAGTNVSLTRNSASEITISASGGGNLPIEDEGTEITGAAAKINFTGAGVTATAAGNDVTVDIPGGGGGTPGGSDTQIQYNDGGSFGGTTGLTWDDSTNILSIATRYEGDINGALLQQVLVKEPGGVSKGDVVYISGGTGDNPEVRKAQANSTSTMAALGIMKNNTAVDAIGECVTSGEITGLNLTGFTTGDELFVSNTTAGELLTSAPTGEANLIQKIGKVIKGGAGGALTVLGAFRTNATPNLDEGSIFIGNSSNQASTLAIGSNTHVLTSNGTTASWQALPASGGVTSFTNAFGTYISGTANTSATGAVTIGTVDLNAVDGTAVAGTRFLSKDNTWDVPAYPANTNIYTTDGTINANRVVTLGSTYSLKVKDSSNVDLLSISENGAIAIGEGASNSTDNCTVMGKGAGVSVSAVSATSIGRDTNSNSFGVSIGAASTCTGGGSIVIGTSTTANNASNAVLIGYDSDIASGKNASIAIGTYIRSSGSRSITFSSRNANVFASADDVFGVYMTSNTTPDFKVVGGGTSDLQTKLDLSEQLLIRGDGSTNAGNLKLNCHANSHHVNLIGPDHTGAVSYNIKFPNGGPGSNNKILESDSSGNLSWINTPTDTNTNIYTDNGTLASDRIISMATYDLTLNNNSSQRIFKFHESTNKLEIGNSSFQRKGTLRIEGEGSNNRGGLLEIEAGGTNNYHVQIKGPDTMSSSYSLGLPAAQGAASTFLKNDGSGNLTWAIPTDTNTNIYTTDGTLSGARTVTMSNTLTFSNSSSQQMFQWNPTTYTYKVGNSVNGLKGTIRIDGGGGSNRGGILEIEEGGSNNRHVQIKGPDSMSASYDIKLPDAQGAANSVLTNNGSGVLTWSTSTSPAEITASTSVNPTTFAATPYTFANTNSSSGVGAPLATQVASQYGNKHISFYLSGTASGAINQAGSSSVNYATSSDYRLKENVVEMTGAVNRVKQLNPSRFNFIADGPSRTVDGFLAHEVSNVVPEAITGEKDAVDAEGNIIPQGIDQSKLVPLLVGAIKELTARIEALEA